MYLPHSSNESRGGKDGRADLHDVDQGGYSLEVDLPLDFLPQVVVRDQFVIFVPQRVHGMSILQLQADTQLANDIVHRQTRLDPCPDGKPLLRRDIVCWDQAGLCGRLAVGLRVSERGGGRSSRAAFV